MNDDLRSYVQFSREAIEPLLDYVPPEITIYAVGEESHPFSSLLFHMLEKDPRNQAEHVSFDFSDVGRLRDGRTFLDNNHKLRYVKELVDGRYQVICIERMGESESGPPDRETDAVYLVGKGIRRLEEDEDLRTLGICVVTGENPGITHFYEVTRSRVLNGLLRDSFETEGVVYGRDARKYVGERYESLKKEVGSDPHLAVFERSGHEFIAQCLTHRLYDDGRVPEYLVDGNGSVTESPTKIIIPGARDMELVESEGNRLKGVELLWMDDVRD